MSASAPSPFLPGRTRHIAKAVTIILNPQWVQLYWLLGVLEYWQVGWNAKLYVLGTMGVVPTVGYLVYSRSLKLDNTYDLPHRYRLVPFVFNFLGLGLMSPIFFLWPEWLQDGREGAGHFFLLATGYCTATSAVAALITLRFKLSLHMVGYAAAAVPLILVNAHAQPHIGLVAMDVFHFCTGALVMAWSRISLKAHTPREIRWGLLVGILLPLLYWAAIWMVS